MIPASKELCDEFPVYTQHLATFDELNDLSFPSAHTILLIAANYGAVSSKEIADTAAILIEKGNAYLCAWGENCEKPEPIWDTAAARSKSKKEHKFHTVVTSHEEETLEEAVWFALNCAFVDEHIKKSCSVVLISIDQPEWQNTIDNIREDPAGFNERSLEDAGADEPGSDDVLPRGLN